MNSFDEVIDKIVEKHPHYHKSAYKFVREALEYTVKNAKPDERLHHQHVTGQKLLDGIREYALIQYGPMALTVFNEWNIKTCEDFGNIVFTLIDYKVLGKTDNDSIDDFKAGYNFYDAFQKPFLAEN